MVEGTLGAPQVPDFLRAKSDRAVKRELKGILQSYHHYWDILAELLQNSRDAIERRKAEQASAGVPVDEGRIHVIVDATQRSVEVIDNGTGIASAFIEEVLAPGGGDKSSHDDQVGEKGVGLTYVAFSGDDFSLATTSGTDSTACTLTGASSWVSADDQSVYPPKFELLDSKPAPAGFESGTYTSIRVGGIPQRASTDLFSLTSDQLKWVLRTRTAIGDTHQLLRGEPLPATTVTYAWTSVDGESITAPIAFGYPELAGPGAAPIDEVNSNLVGKTDAASRKYLTGKVVTGHRVIGSGTDTLRVYGVMLPGNRAVDALAEAYHLGVDEDGASAILNAGIFVVTKSMPTGVAISPAQRGAYPAYYKRCIFLVESDRIDFDLGRKSMHWQHERRLQNAVADLFVQFERVAKYQAPSETSPVAPTPETSAERKQRIKKMWEQAEGRHPLGWPGVAFAKVPTNQEAAVAALFHELLGAQQIKNIRPLAAGYSTQYDLLAHYVGGGEELPIVIEFKDKLESVLSDFRDGVKAIGDIDLLVCWDANQIKIAEVGLQLNPEPNPPYDGVTHQLHLPAEISPEPIPVIVLKSLLEKTVAP
ncbi:ATP-binding protein [Nocardioides terrigena]|uniref:ATP-binding protein n=1 Tax=Nocardioides terrigena TaxID=424797 RepID=UPI000D308B79|nr:ATP-binding protein [Nocardioides terrigena]